MFHTLVRGVGDAETAVEGQMANNETFFRLRHTAKKSHQPTHAHNHHIYRVKKHTINPAEICANHPPPTYPPNIRDPKPTSC